MPGSTTNTEKQLIGRGARYYPFVFDGNKDEMYTRKFDYNEFHELRVLEQLHYHSANNPKYISELKQVLIESGIYDDQNQVERTINLKSDFKHTYTYTNGVVWMNEQISQQDTWSKQNESLFDSSFIPDSFPVMLPIQSSKDFSAFDNNAPILNAADSLSSSTVKLKKIITKNVIRAAINRNKSYIFSN